VEKLQAEYNTLKETLVSFITGQELAKELGVLDDADTLALGVIEMKLEKAIKTRLDEYNTQRKA
jgi:hypothetical protein